LFDVLPPSAFAVAARLAKLFASRPSSLRRGQASRSIDTTAGLELVRADGTAEAFAPPTRSETIGEFAIAAANAMLGRAPKGEGESGTGAEGQVEVGSLANLVTGLESLPAEVEGELMLFGLAGPTLASLLLAVVFAPRCCEVHSG